MPYKPNDFMRIWSRLGFISSWLGWVLAVSAGPLDRGFMHPPDAVKPQTWWHWMNGNITKAGITADLEAMKSIGLGGATIVNVDCGIPRGPVAFMSPEWREDFKFAVQEASRLGLELCVENCAGWSSSGGPWNTVTNAMQRVTFSEIRVEGPANFSAALPKPPTNLGYYRDIAVLAFPSPMDEGVRMADFAPVVSASGSEQPGNKLTDADPKTMIHLPAPKRGNPQFAQLEFQKPFTACMVKIVAGEGMPECSGEILVSDNGKNFRVLKPFIFGRKSTTTPMISLGLPPVAARFWRVQFTDLGDKAKATEIPLAEIELAPRLGIENIDAKAGFNGGFALSSHETDEATAGSLHRNEMIDLSGSLAADGKLNWQIPAGEWVILRLGYTPTGAINHPATKEGEGLECDKFSKAALDAHWAGFMGKILDDIGPLAGKSLNSSLIDSYEVGGQNWTAQFREEFQVRRGYDPLKFLPTLTGRVVDNPALSERFLWDFRRTIADLFAENYFGHFAKICRQHGLQNAVEPYTGPFESMQSGATADVVMGEFWSGSQGHPSVKLAASIAHAYGKTIVGAESFTASPDAGRWLNDPYSLKTLGDQMFCQGLTRYIFHRYAMQPWTNHWPGMTMGQWGFHFERTVTWWNQGKPWIDYISRCQFLLQQGRSVADVAYFTGESAPVEMRIGQPALPSGYDYDAVNADVLLHGAVVKNGRIVLTSGANYAALVLPSNDADLTPQLLQKIHDLVRSGATVIGPRPEHSPSLSGFPECDARVQKLANELWGRCDGIKVFENAVGKGRIVWGKSLSDIFLAQDLKPDFEFSGTGKASQLAYAHRATRAEEIYFVSNQRRQFDTAECTFRVGGKIPELWHPETGLIEPAPVWMDESGRTKVRLDFEPAGSIFVIFRNNNLLTDHIVKVNGRFAPEPAVKTNLVILKAIYAATDGSGEMDVTRKIADQLGAGQFLVTVNNDTLGSDPAVNHVKELRLNYTRDGKSGQMKSLEGETMTLPATCTIGQPPYLELNSGDNKSPVVRLWGNGQVVLMTSSGKVVRATTSDLPAPQEITGPWNLNFPPDWRTPASVTFDKLISWTDCAKEEVRYFSGTATYEKELVISADRLFSGRELWLDLGVVKNFAEVWLNNEKLGILWKPPFRVNLSTAARRGSNKLVVKITNLWPNRLIGDEQLPEDCEWNGKQLKAWPQWLLEGKPSPTGRLAFTTWHHWTKDAPLVESGLIGPVKLLTAAVIAPQ